MNIDSKTLPQGLSRHLYTGVSIGIAVVVFIGFARTYYLKAVFGTPVISLLVHLHGLVMTGWLVIFGFQVWLVRTRRVHLHRRVGVVAAIWATLVLIVGAVTAITAAKLGRAPAGPPLVFLAIPLGDLVAFGGLSSVGLCYRSRPEIHRRLMLLSSLSLLPPAFGRFPFEFCHAPLAFFGLTDLVVLACVIYDTVKHRRLHPAFLWGGAFMIITQPLRLMLSATPAWMQFASWLVH